MQTYSSMFFWTRRFLFYSEHQWQRKTEKSSHVSHSPGLDLRPHCNNNVRTTNTRSRVSFRPPIAVKTSSGKKRPFFFLHRHLRTEDEGEEIPEMEVRMGQEEDGERRYYLVGGKSGSSLPDVIYRQIGNGYPQKGKKEGKPISSISRPDCRSYFPKRPFVFLRLFFSLRSFLPFLFCLSSFFGRGGGPPSPFSFFFVPFLFPFSPSTYFDSASTRRRPKLFLLRQKEASSFPPSKLLPHPLPLRELTCLPRRRRRRRRRPRRRTRVRIPGHCYNKDKGKHEIKVVLF